MEEGKPVVSQAAAVEEAHRAFDALDKNGDGVLTKEDIQQAKAASGQPLLPNADGAAEKTASGILSNKSFQASEAGSKHSSFLNPTGPAPGVPPPQQAGPWGEIFLFMCFVATRACHPTIIDGSKTVDPVTGKKGFAYNEGSVTIVMCIVVIAACQLTCLMRGGVKEWKTIYDPHTLKIFSLIGVFQAFGDYLEMASMGKLQGAAYQVLLQSKFLVTAILMGYLKGTVQTRLQWILLIALMLSMSVYMCISKGDSNSSLPLMGLVFAMFKVIVSCLGSVLTDKYTKQLVDPKIHVQLAQMGFARLCVAIVLAGSSPWTEGLFAGWDDYTIFVSISFIFKTVVSLYLVALLDSLLKNIGEAMAVLAIYAYQVYPQLTCSMAPEGLIVTPEIASLYCDPKNPFKMPPMLAVLVVVLIVGAYLDAKTVVDKAKKYDAAQKASA